MKGLVIKRPWIDFILEGEKIWEIRGRTVSLRERIALIEGGSGLVRGACDIIDCRGPLSNEEIQANQDKHRVPPERMREVTYEKTYAWVLGNVRRFDHPVSYKHPSGAVIWVSLNEENVPDFSRLLNEVNSGRAGNCSNGHGAQAKNMAISKPPTKRSEHAEGQRQLQSVRGGSVNPDSIAARLSTEFGSPSDSTNYAYRWRLAGGLGIGLERRGNSSATVFVGRGVELAGTDLDVDQIQTGVEKYGLNSNMKLVPGCEPGKLVQRVLLSNAVDIETFIECVRSSMRG